MKKTIYIVVIIQCWLSAGLLAQTQNTPLPHRIRPASEKKAGASVVSKDSAEQLPSYRSWVIDEVTGAQTPQDRDTLLYNYHQRSLQDGRTLGVGYLGNLGSPSYSKLYFEGYDKTEFTYWDVLSPYYKRPGNTLFYNTKVPISNIHYLSGGSGAYKEERFEALISTNVNKRLNLAFDIDYQYARGQYQSLSNKALNYSVRANYLGDRYELHAWAGNNYTLLSENGGMSNDLFITNPNSPSLPSNYTAADYPVKLSQTWNRLRMQQFYAANRYHIGYYRKEKKRINEQDTIVKTFVPVASLVFNSHFTKQSRHFFSYDTAFVSSGSKVRNIDTLYSNVYFDQAPSHRSSLTEWRNTAGIAMREGFRPWVKFGLMAYISNVNRRFHLPTESGISQINHNATSIGGTLTKTTGKYLQYNLGADIGVLGVDLGEFTLSGEVSTFLNIKGKQASLTARGYIKNEQPLFIEENMYSKYFKWNTDFSDTRKVFVGGELNIPHTGTQVSIGVENVQNHLHYGADTLFSQHSGNVQVLSARINQQLRAGILHWNTQVAYQTTSHESVIPVPTLSAYTNLYLQTKIAKVLTVQLGADAHFHTNYYAPAYEPALMKFYNQRQVKVGGFPMSTIYLNAHLQKTRFFAMYYNVLKNTGANGYFSIPHYPLNPTIFKVGVSWDFSN